MLDEGIVLANHRVNLTHPLHHLQVVDVDLGWNQVYIPEHKVSMEKYHSFHSVSCQVRKIVKEPCSNYLIGFQLSMCLFASKSFDKLANM